MLWPASNRDAQKNQSENLASGDCCADNDLGGRYESRTCRNSRQGFYNAARCIAVNYVETGFFEPDSGIMRRYVFIGAFSLPAGFY